MSFNRNKTLAKAQKLLQKGKVAEAIKEYQEIVDNDPADVRTLLKVGDLQAKIGNVEAANETYRKVAEHYAKDGFFLKAVAVFKQILKLDPGLVAVYIRLAELYQQLGLNSEAMKQYQTVARHYENQGLKKEALDVLRKMAELDPENTASRVKLAELYAREGHGEAAREQFKAVANDLKRKQNSQDLVRVYEKMELLGIAEPATKLEISELYLKLAEPKKALQRLQDAFAAEPKNPAVLELLARTFLDLQQSEKAKSVYRELSGILESKGMIEDRDRIHARLRALGVADAGSAFAAPGASSTSSPKPTVAPSAPASPESAARGTKLLGEIEILLQYGLLEKACETMTRFLLADPGNAPIRAKLVEAFQSKNDLVSLMEVLQNVAESAQKAGLSAVVIEIQSEIAGFSGSAAPAEAEEVIELGQDLALEEELELEIVDDEAPPPESTAAILPNMGDFERAEAAPEPLLLDESEPVMAESAQEEEAPSFDLDLEPVAEAAQSLSPASEPDSSLEMDLEGIEIPALEVAAPEVEAPKVEPPKPDPPKLEPPIESPPELENTNVFRRPASEGDDDIFASDMEEATYFIQMGLLDEARDVLEGILAQKKDYEPARNKLEEMSNAGATKSKAKPKPPRLVEDEPPRRSASTERVIREKEVALKDGGKEVFFDLSNELQDEIGDLERELSRPKGSDEEDYLSPEEVISEFKKGVARTVAKDDYQTHYNLGIAYKEMGLLDEAIHEFDLAAQDVRMSIDCASMIGLCLVGKKEYDTAIDVYRRALGRTKADSVEALGLSYELAEAYIGYGNLHDAYRMFARIRDVDPTFRDVRRRAKELEADLGSSAPHPSAPEKPAKEAVVDISKKKTKITYI